MNARPVIATRRFDASPAERTERHSGIVLRERQGEWRRVERGPMRLGGLILLGALVVALAATWAAVSGCTSTLPPVKVPVVTDASTVVTMAHDGWIISGGPR